MPLSSSKTIANAALGDEVVKTVAQAKDEVVLVAPFIKRAAIDRVLSGCVATSLGCITRWKPVEIAAGVSDLAVYETVRDSGGSLWLRHDLHAKYFRGDDHVLVGSANLTGAALGWSASPNLELLVPLDRFDENAVAFEREVRRHCVLVTDDLYEQFLVAEAEWTNSLPRPPHELPVASSGAPAPAAHTWLPQTRQPQDLYRVYATTDTDSLPRPMRSRASVDLTVLAVPPGLPESAFNAVAAASLLATTVHHGLDSLVSTPQRFGAVRDFLMAEHGLDRAAADEAWQTIIRWLRHFLPNRYEYSRPRHSEVIRRRT